MVTNQSSNERLFALATESVKQRNFEQAILQLKTFLAQEPKNEIALGMLAAVYTEIKMTDRAAEYYRRVLAINPTNPLACLQLGLLQLAARHSNDVLQTWRACLKEPDDFLGHYYSGLALLQLERTTDARTMLAEASRRMPEDHPLSADLQNLLAQLTR